MTTSDRTLDELFEAEIAFPPLSGSKTAVFLSRAERLVPTRQELGKTTAGATFFIGRHQELHELSEAISRQTQVVFLSGVAGVGKTALIQQFLRSQPAISAVFIDQLNAAWPDIAAGFVELFGKIPTLSPSRESAGSESTSLWSSVFASHLSLDRVILIFDNFDRDESALEKTSRSLVDLIEKLRPAIGNHITILISSRGAFPLKDFGFLRHHSMVLQPFSQIDRLDFLNQVSANANIKLDGNACKAIADSSFGLPLMLKSFLARSEEQSRLNQDRNIFVHASHFCDALQHSFSDVVYGFDKHLLSLGRLRNVDWHVLEAIASFNTLSSIPTVDLVAKVQDYSRKDVRESVDRLAAENVVSSVRGSINVKRSLLLPYVRAVKWQQADGAKSRPIRTSLLELVAATKMAISASKRLVSAGRKHSRRRNRK